MKTTVLILAIILTSAAFAQNLVVPVPRSQIALPESSSQPVLAPAYFDITTSSWTPENLQQPSHLSETSSFRKSGPSKLSFDISSPVGQASWGLFSSKLGLSYMQLERSGFLGIENSGYTVSQNLNLFQGRLAAEWTTKQDIARDLRPYVDLGVLPTWAQSSASQFNDGVSDMSVIGEAGIGLTFNLTPLAHWLSLSQVALDLGFETTRGFDNDQLNGSGVRLGTRIGWN
jgi:hypothetical protein